jgi:prepilin-type N-terminal cleavage/methylation domain-containing protein
VKRRAFTLVEVMVALTVTGLVIAMAYASVQAGLDTAARIETAQAGEERETVARSILVRAFRHAVSGTIGGEPVFVLLDVAGGDELRFRTRGVSEPLGASELWEVSLTPGPQGVRLSGFAVDDRAKSFEAVLPRIAAVDVRVRGRDYRDGWFESWPITDRSPVAVSIRFLSAEGRSVGAGLSTRVGLEGNP